ncbi:MAG: hypothetical protein JSR84_01095 [Proteobacteria bacterium]|nr:hypothetical protein [Pseudomonadota bacterium]
MSDAPDVDAVAAEARDLLDARVTSVRELAKAQAEVAHVQERHEDELAAVTSAHADAYAAAKKGGWSEQELKKLGLVAPVKRTAARSRRTRRGSGATGDGQAPATE